QVWNNVTNECVPFSDTQCPPNSTWLSETDECDCFLEGQVWDNVTNECVPFSDTQCPPNSTWLAETDECDCFLEGQVWNNVTNECVPFSDTQCPPNSTWIPDTQGCTCPEGEVWYSGEAVCISLCAHSQNGDTYCPKSDVCVFLEDDKYNCGGCGFQCQYGCANSTCTCPETEVLDESGACVNITDPTETCSEGLNLCGYNCTDFMFDNDNCGGCGLPCNGTCDDGYCYPPEPEASASSTGTTLTQVPTFTFTGFLTTLITPTPLPTLAPLPGACSPPCGAGSSCLNGTCHATSTAAATFIANGLQGDWR
ncbi:hypothetical protein K458DRAFT_381684, partial [Lentithecium fluviatile CBS 122367]